MFSDVIFDCLIELENALDPKFSFKAVYVPEEVIKMFEQMILVRFLSDARLPNGELAKPISELRTMAHDEAIKLYNRKMGNN